MAVDPVFEKCVESLVAAFIGGIATLLATGGKKKKKRVSCT